MQKALRFLLNLHHGEEKRAFFFLFLGLVWGIGCYGSWALAEGLFLEEVGASALPTTYLWSSSLLCLFSSLILYNLFKKKFPKKRFF
ncbi:hypothetical protein H359_0554 [Chlamydia ibidis 10-1398/6]|uniref:Uncharacterized protein n=1 Tax=Chlamydia ibidis 10-1398/6 TaxID=1046581 RepID=A0ABN0MZC7_9CHLA|nr:hypothetical protein H359_0554 [Chlamydia ibidis 10-1398/6]